MTLAFTRVTHSCVQLDSWAVGSHRPVVGKAQRMYDARTFTMAEIAASCGVTPMTVYRNIRVRPADQQVSSIR